MEQSILRGMLGLSLILFASATTFAQGLKVTLLGTGSPIPLVERFGPSTLVEAGTEKLLFDCGRGVPIRLWQL
jgi:ribonuclease Z